MPDGHGDNVATRRDRVSKRFSAAIRREVIKAGVFGSAALALPIQNSLPPVHETLGYQQWTSVHLHGAASLPQYDGYASDVTRPGQYPDSTRTTSTRTCSMRGPCGTTTMACITPPRTSTTACWRCICCPTIQAPGWRVDHQRAHVGRRGQEQSSSSSSARSTTGPTDVVCLGENEVVRVLAKFDAGYGKYMIHCHNRVHEDHDMMSQFEVVGPDNRGDDPLGTPCKNEPEEDEF